MVFLTYRPVRLYVKIFPYEEEPYWARQSELQEFFMANDTGYLYLVYRLAAATDARSAARLAQ